jgi:hypothetical protein
MAAEKKTFDQALAEAEANRHNSNIANLASAMNMIAEEEERLNSRLAELEELKSEIKDAGNDPALKYETVRELYNRAFERKYIKSAK